jgi:gluconate 5-dehydrogenase
VNLHLHFCHLQYGGNVNFPGFSLDGKVALVTGAGRGLGLEIAKGLAVSGVQVFVNGRNLTTLQQAITTIPGLAIPLPFDVADETAVTAAIAAIQAQYGRLDILVNNVGIRDRRGLFDLELTAVRQLIDTNLIAPFHLSREAAKVMVEGGNGRIINITSIADSLARAGDAAYTTAKGGLAALTRALAAELGSFGITVNGVSPGYFATETNATMVANPDIDDWLQKRTSLGRWGNPSEIVGAVLFFASPAASYITGQILAVDGGYMAHF